MDSLTTSLQECVSISVDPLDTSKPHPRLSQFKRKRDGYCDQEVRRARLLEEQQFRRRDFSDYARKMVSEELHDDSIIVSAPSGPETNSIAMDEGV